MNGLKDLMNFKSSRINTILTTNRVRLLKAFCLEPKKIIPVLILSIS